MKTAVGTTSELKLRAVKNALARAGVAAEVVGYKVESGVRKQPFTKKEIIQGATNRALNALGQDTNADFGLGIESGIVLDTETGKFFELAGAVLVNSKGENAGTAFSAAVETPLKIVERIKAEDSEAGVVVGEISGNPEKDPIFYYTGNKMKREELLEDAIFLALTKQFLNPQAYQ